MWHQQEPSVASPTAEPARQEAAGPERGVLVDARCPRRAHMVGIAGAGMRSLASVLLGWGWRVSGSDLAPASTHPLAAGGGRIYEGHAASQLSPATELVIYSDAIPSENAELRRAARLGIPALSYFRMLGRLMSGRRGLAVAGTHGKSTATAMAAGLFLDAGLDPTVVYGARPLGGGSGGRAGGGKLMLVEACEYRANFLHLRPSQAVILGIEPDHFDCYPSPEPLEEAFARFARSVPEHGLVLARAGCRRTERVTAGLACRVETFGPERRADWSAEGLSDWRGRYRFGILYRGCHLGEVQLRIPGVHNVPNALAAAALAWHNGVAPERIVRGLGRFRGLARRLEVVGSWHGAAWVDDYAHHPTEVDAGLRAVRRMYPGRRVWCVFQPHQASRTRHLLDELATSLNNADRVLVLEIFRAREPRRAPGDVTGRDLAERVRQLGGHALGAGPTTPPVLHADGDALAELEHHFGPGDVVVTMGAGDIRKVCDGVVGRLREDRAAG